MYSLNGTISGYCPNLRKLLVNSAPIGNVVMHEPINTKSETLVSGKNDALNVSLIMSPRFTEYPVIDDV